MDDKKIVALLDKTGNLPFYFGGYDIAYFWRIAKVDGKIYVQRVVYTDVKQEESFSCCLASDESSKQEIFDDVVLDFAVFYADVWQSGRGQIEGVFKETAGVDDAGLQDILEALDKPYSAFLNSVLYWYGIVIESKPNCDGKKQIRDNGCLDATGRIAKNVIDKLADNGPLVVVQGNSTFEWNLVKSHEKIWYSRRTLRDHGSYVLCSEEYGRVLSSDPDSFGALRDAISSCFMLDGWEIQKDCNPEKLLCLVDLSLEAI